MTFAILPLSRLILRHFVEIYEVCTGIYFGFLSINLMFDNCKQYRQECRSVRRCDAPARIPAD